MTGPKLLFDENLSPRLVNLLSEDFPESVHVDSASLHGRPDGDVESFVGDAEAALLVVQIEGDYP